MALYFSRIPEFPDPFSGKCFSLLDANSGEFREFLILHGMTSRQKEIAQMPICAHTVYEWNRIQNEITIFKQRSAVILFSVVLVEAVDALRRTAHSRSIHELNFQPIISFRAEDPNGYCEVLANAYIKLFNDKNAGNATLSILFFPEKDTKPFIMFIVRPTVKND